MNKSDCFYLGYISKQRGFKGQLLAFLDVDNPQNYKELESVFVEINNKLTPFFIDHIELDHKGFVLITFQGVNADVAKLLKKDLYLPLSMLPQLEDDDYYLHELEGMQVVDSEHGNIGSVQRVIDQPGNRLLVVMQGHTEILIPLNERVVSSVDKASKRIDIIAPEGLIDIYLNSDDEPL